MNYSLGCTFHNMYEHTWVHKGVLIWIFFVLCIHMLHKLWFIVVYMYGGHLENIQHLCLYGRVAYWSSFIWNDVWTRMRSVIMITCWFMILVHKAMTRQIVVLEKTNQTCPRMLSKKELMQLQMIYTKDVELQSELWHALDVLTNEHENVEMPSQSNLKSIVAYVEAGESRMFKVNLLVNWMVIRLYPMIDWLGLG